ncbi:MAG: hypothetical protein JO362_14860 [Streptomycetaceae bacterium]|nr:hypothetical protein [Streptomycetaceae bacterium]
MSVRIMGLRLGMGGMILRELCPFIFMDRMNMDRMNAFLSGKAGSGDIAGPGLGMMMAPSDPWSLVSVSW